MSLSEAGIWWACWRQAIGITLEAESGLRAQPAVSCAPRAWDLRAPGLQSSLSFCQGSVFLLEHWSFYSKYWFALNTATTISNHYIFHKKQPPQSVFPEYSEVFFFTFLWSRLVRRMSLCLCSLAPRFHVSVVPESSTTSPSEHHLS